MTFHFMLEWFSCMRITSSMCAEPTALWDGLILALTKKIQGRFRRPATRDEMQEIPSHSQTIGLPKPEHPGNCHPIRVTESITAHESSAGCRCTCSRNAQSAAASNRFSFLSTNSGTDAPFASGACRIHGAARFEACRPNDQDHRWTHPDACGRLSPNPQRDGQADRSGLSPACATTLHRPTQFPPGRG